MQRILYILSILVLLAEPLVAQTWYTQGQQAVYIPVPKQGIYALSGNQLPSLVGTPAQTLKLYHNGQQVAISITDANTDGIFSGTDSLFFFGKQNQGEAERAYYQRPQYQNPDNPLYGLNGRYYLLQSVGTGKRIANTAINPSAADAEWQAVFKVVPRLEYNFGLGNLVSKFHASTVGNGEGWCSFSSGHSAQIINPYAARAGAAQIRAAFCGRNAGTKAVTINLGSTRALASTVVSYTRKEDSANVDAALLGPTINFLFASEQQTASLMWAKLQVPVQAKAVNNPALLVSTQLGNQPLKFTNAGVGGYLLQVSSEYAPKWLTADAGKLYVDAGIADNKPAVWLQTRAFTLPDSILKRVSLGSEPLPLNGEVVFVTPSQLADSVEVYANYRRSVAGGQYSVRIIKVEKLYTQYGYGYPTSQAIRAYFLDAYSKGIVPKAVFLFGKGLQHNYMGGDINLPENTMPTWGYPASDNYITTADTGLFVNKTPISRLAAKSGQEVMDYLRKVQVQEAQTDGSWRKRGAHLSGGRTEGEIQQFRNYAQSYTRIIAGKPIGGSAFEYSKQSLSVIEAVNIRNTVNAGLGIMTLFGHSASTTTDVDIGYVTDPAQGYDNAGKCPLIVVNGCFSGDIFQRGAGSLNENWVLTPKKGAIAFAGSMDEGLPTLLIRQSTFLYQVQYQDTSTLYRPLGEVFREANARYFKDGGGRGPFDSIVVSQTILHGDPLVRLFPYSKPDFSFNTANSRLLDQDVTAANKSFSLRLTVQNMGLYNPKDSISLLVKVSGVGKSIVGRPILLPSLKTDTTIDYTIAGVINLDNSSTIECVLDYLNKVPEQSEENNTLTLGVGRFQSGVFIVDPAPDAIVGSRFFNLQYRTVSSPLATGVEFQVDTNQFFASASKLKLTGSVGPLQQVRVTLPTLADSTVFFVRYRLRQGADSLSWKTFACTYIPAKSGFSQSTGFQFATNEQEGFTIDSTKRRLPWRYIAKTSTIRLYTVGDSVRPTRANTGIDVNGVPFFYGSASNCLSIGQNMLHCLRLKRISLEPYVQTLNPVDQFWRYSCGRLPTSINFYGTEDLKLGFGSLSGYYIAEMAPGDYYFAISQGKLDYPNLGAWIIGASTFVGVHTDSLKKATVGSPFVTYGIRTRNSLPNIGFTVLAKKNNAINDRKEVIDTTIIIRKQPTEGRVSSVFIGPAVRFDKVSLGILRSAGLVDTGVFTIRAYKDFTDTGVVVYQGLPRSFSLKNLPADKRFVKLFYEAPNRGDSTAYLDFWRVYYTQFPEGVAVTASTNNTIDAGDTARFEAKYVHTLGNVGDTLLANMYVRNQAGAILNFTQVKALRKAGTDTTYVRTKFLTKLTSPDTLQFEAIFNTGLSPERDYSNNNIFGRVVLKKDLNVYAGYFEVDGTLPELGMKTSASPEIVYTLNQSFSNRELVLQFGPSCDTCNVVTVNNAVMQGSRAVFTPKNLKPGMYQVRGVVKDRFRLLVPQQTAYFEVVGTDTLTLFKMYPNPARDNVGFYYQSTALYNGGTAALQVFNYFGKQVFSAEQQHTGLIAGTITWNLQSEGQQLPPGVYLAQFRVINNNPDGTTGKVTYRTVRLVVVR